MLFNNFTNYLGKLSRANYWLLWTLIVPVMVFLNVVAYGRAFDLFGDKPAETTQVTTRIISDIGSRPSPTHKASEPSPTSTRKPKRKTAPASPSASPSASVTPSAKPTSAPASSAPAAKPTTEAPSPDPTQTTTPPDPGENPDPGNNDDEPVLLPTDPVTVIIDITE